MLGAHGRKCRAVVDASEHLVDGYVVTLQNVSYDVGVFEMQRVIVAGSEQRTMDGGGEFGEVVANDASGLQRDDAGVLLGLFPDTGSSFGDMNVAQRER